MTQPAEQTFPDPFGEVARRQLNHATVMASFVEAVARWRYTQKQKAADPDTRQANRAARAEETEHRDAGVFRRFEIAQQQAAAAMYGQASDEFLLNADLRTLAQTWGAAAAYHDQDPNAADAMRRVEIRLRVLQPDAMAVYDTLRKAGATPADAMSKAAGLMDPTPRSDTPFARPAGSRAGSLEAAPVRRSDTSSTRPAGDRADRDSPGPVTDGDVVPVGGPGDVPRPPAGIDLLRQLRSVDAYLGVIAAGSGDPARVDRIAETRTQLRRDIDHIETVLRSTGSGPTVTAAYEAAMHRWVPLHTTVPTTDPAAATDTAGRVNELQRRVATAVYSRAFDEGWRQRADVVQLGEAWAAAAAHPGDRRAQRAQRRIEDQLRRAQPAAMGVYDALRADNVPPEEAMLRVAPLMEPGRAPLHPGEWPAVTAAARRGHVATPPVAEELPAGVQTTDQLRNRLQGLDRHLEDVIGHSPAGSAWRDQAYTVLAELDEEIHHLANTDRPQAPAGRRPAGLKAPELAGEGFPTTAAVDVTQARQSRHGQPSRAARNAPRSPNPTPHRTAGDP